MDYETVIGLEVHSQLLTKAKMFCRCSAGYQDSPPNTLVCPVCMGMPGVLPVINRRAVELVIKTGLALNCTIARDSKFDRKNYPYPDLMKGYQISQYGEPIATNGNLTIDINGTDKRIGITRVHLEEDVAKLFHRTEQNGEGYSLLDINRAGVALMEVVSEPDIGSPEEARNYLIQLRSILRYIGVSTANMEEGSFRCDANISIRPKGSTKLGPRTEVKNVNSFRSVYRALHYEAERQISLVLQGESVAQETRGWDESRGVTLMQRTKEYASDYRYFPEPDLPPIVISPEWVQKIRGNLPELPRERKTRIIETYELSEYDANLLTISQTMADFFEASMAITSLTGQSKQLLAKAVSNWTLGEMSRLLNTTGTPITETKIQPAHLLELIGLVESGNLNSSMAKTVFEEMFKSGHPPGQISETLGMVQLSDSDALMTVVAEVIKNNPQPSTDYLNGKETAIRFLVGQVMKGTRGKANPQLVSQLLKDQLDSVG